MVLIKLRKKINRHAFLYVRTQGGGVKRLYRFLDLRGLLQLYLPSIFLAYIYDPCRTSYLSLFIFVNGIISYRIGTSDLDLFSIFFPVWEDDQNKLKNGSIGLLQHIKGGSFLNCLSLFTGGNGVLARSAGLYVYLLRNDLQRRLSYIRVKRGLTLIFDYSTIATMGRVCNVFYSDFKKGNAGVARLLGIRPIVRGIAMNPVDHPNGGRTPGGKVYRSFSNKISRSSFKTRKPSRFYNRYVHF